MKSSVNFPCRGSLTLLQVYRSCRLKQAPQADYRQRRFALPIKVFVRLAYMSAGSAMMRVCDGAHPSISQASQGSLAGMKEHWPELVDLAVLLPTIVQALTV